MDRTRLALRQMAREDPELAARLVLQTLPAAAAHIPGRLAYDLAVEGIGVYRVEADDGRATVTRLTGEDAESSPAELDFRLTADPATLADLGAGTSPVKLMLGGRLRIRGKRRKAMKLHAMSEAEPSVQEVARQGGRVDPDLLYRSLQYMIDPEWTRGHRFSVCYEIDGEEGGRWVVHVRDGERLLVTGGDDDGRPDTTMRLSHDTFRRLLTGELTPTTAMQGRLTTAEGKIFYGTLLGRWIERSQGRDDDELAREERQRALQARRSGSWGSASANGGAGTAAATPGGQGDPAHDSERDRRAGAALLGYGQLYALWERQNWKAHELDFSVDREHWLASPSDSQRDTAWSLGSFYIGEERVTADLAPFLLAAPSGEVEVFLATQLVDEARHAAFFDRFGGEVMVLEGEDLRGRMRELEKNMSPAWHEVFDDGLRGIATRIKERPDDLELFIDGIVTYHMVIEGVLAMTGQHLILEYMQQHGLYPGFCQGFSMVERDEHRHIAFGVRFLKEMVELDPRHGDLIERRIAELVPRAAHVFVPPYVDDPSDFTSYSNHSSEIYGYAYRSLKRRMAVIGLQVPPPEELMPGPIADPAAAG